MSIIIGKQHKTRTAVSHSKAFIFITDMNIERNMSDFKLISYKTVMFFKHVT